LMRVVDIDADLFAVELVVVRQDIGGGHVQRLDAEDAGHLLLVDKSRIGKFLEPVEIVKSGVIDAVGAAGSHVSGGDTEMLDEDAVVGAAAQIADRNIIFNASIG